MSSEPISVTLNDVKASHGKIREHVYLSLSDVRHDWAASSIASST